MPLFRKKAPPPKPVEHAVIVHLSITGDEFGEVAEREEIFALEDRLIAAIDSAGVGEFDGNEFGGGEAVLYMYGPDADALFEEVEPILREFPVRPAWCKLRYGEAADPTSIERRLDL